MTEHLATAALSLPWLACAAGWALIVAAHAPLHDWTAPPRRFP